MMRHIDQCPRVIVFSCLFLFTAGFTDNTEAKEFLPPELEGFNLHAERDADGDGDGIKETHIKQFLNLSGDSIVSMSIKEHVWAWTINTLNNSSAEKNYVIRDSDCNGKFDEVYGLDDKFYVPECLK